ncbi:transglycosylase SLT domain-containing protein [Thermaurantiacus sp.]
MQVDGLARLPAALRRAGEAVAPVIAAAARATGADFPTLFATARLESGFQTQARAATSSATGLFQFIDSTWLHMLARHGDKHGIRATTRAEALALRADPWAAALMAGAFMAENRDRIEHALGRAASPADLYLAHFLGAGGAIRFLSALATAPQTAGAELFPKAARANRAIFFAGGTPRSLADIHALFRHRLGIGTDVPEAATARASDGTQLPRLGASTEAAVARGPEDASTMDARRAAQAAYLLLASLGA